MNIKKTLKNNTKLIIIMAIIIILGTIGITFAVTSQSDAVAVNTTAGTLDAVITYDTGYSNNITNTGNMLPISDSLVTGIDVTDSRVLKVKFNVTGASGNPSDTIYDVAFHADNIDCELRTTDLKWRLYKGTTQISSGSLSPTFDIMNKNRLVLTNTQQPLTTSTDQYTFLLWISESCTGDITNCTASMDQSKYLNKDLSGTIKIELSTKKTKQLVRTTGWELNCE